MGKVLPAALELLPAMPNEFGCKLAVNKKAYGPLKIQLRGWRWTAAKPRCKSA